MIRPRKARLHYEDRRCKFDPFNRPTRACALDDIPRGSSRSVFSRGLTASGRAGRRRSRDRPKFLRATNFRDEWCEHYQPHCYRSTGHPGGVTNLWTLTMGGNCSNAIALTITNSTIAGVVLNNGTIHTTNGINSSAGVFVSQSTLNGGFMNSTNKTISATPANTATQAFGLLFSSSTVTSATGAGITNGTINAVSTSTARGIQFTGPTVISGTTAGIRTRGRSRLPEALWEPASGSVAAQ